MKNQGNPLANIMAFTTIFIIGMSTKHCIKKYSNGGLGKRGVLLKYHKKHTWGVF